MWSKIGRLISIGNSRGNPLGLFQVSLLDKQKIKLPRGSTLLLYSDGVTEANNEKDEFFGTEDLKSTVPGLLENSAQEVCDQLLEKLNLFYGNLPQSDDITLLSLKALP